MHRRAGQGATFFCTAGETRRPGNAGDPAGILSVGNLIVFAGSVANRCQAADQRQEGHAVASGGALFHVLVLFSVLCCPGVEGFLRSLIGGRAVYDGAAFLYRTFCGEASRDLAVVEKRGGEMEAAVALGDYRGLLHYFFEEEIAGWMAVSYFTLP